MQAAAHAFDRSQSGSEAVVGKLARKIRRDIRAGADALDLKSRRAVERVLEYAAEAEQLLAEQAQRISQLETLSETDELTGLLNRRGFNAVLTRTLANARRYDESGLLAFIDLNGFKAINDRFGHDAGDAVLQGVARLLSENLRDTDYVARIGGDEFVVLFVRGDADGAAARAKNLRNLIASARFDHQGRQLGVGAAVGLAEYGPDCDVDSLFKSADAAMYDDKRGCAEAA